MRHSNIKKLVYLSLLTALAVTMHTVESWIPMPLPPGVKLGIANIISLVVVEIYDIKEMFIVNIFRVILSSFVGGPAIFSYPWMMSCGGVAFSSLSLVLSKKILKLPMISMSIMCAITHVIGQVAVLSMIMNSEAFMGYVFIALFSSIPTGIFTGTVAMEVLKRIKKGQFK